MKIIKYLTFCLCFLPLNSLADDLSIISWGKNTSGQLIHEGVSSSSQISAGGMASYIYDFEGKTEVYGCLDEKKDYDQCDFDLPPEGYIAEFGGLRTTELPFLFFDAAYGHGCGVNTNGEIECVGCGRPLMNFQCDVGNHTKVFDQAKDLSDILSTSHYLTCYIDKNGFAKCTGCDAEVSESHSLCSPPQDIKFKMIRSGTHIAGGINENNEIVIWGDEGYSHNIESGSLAKDLSIGPNTACYIDMDNKINCSQIDKVSLREISVSSHRYENDPNFEDMEGFSTSIKIDEIPKDQFFIKVVTGRDGICAVNKDGILDCWGCRNYEGSVCDLPYRPMRVKDFDLSFEHILAIVNSGDVPPDFELNEFEGGSKTVILNEPESIQDADYDFINHIGMKFKTIYGGKFYKGSCGYSIEEHELIREKLETGKEITHRECPEGHPVDMEALENEFPMHKVVLDYNYQLAVFEVTIGQYMQFLDETNYQMPEEFYRYNDLPDYYPVSYVNFHDSRVFLQWLNENKPESDMGFYRLPSESEWEHAARAGAKTIYPWGNKMIKGKANCKGCLVEHPDQPYPIGSFDPNQFGLFDMHGNVDEWTTDCMSDDYTNTPRDGYPNQSEKCENQVVKGGSWEYGIENLRSAWRDYYHPVDRTDEQGFRVLRHIEKIK